MFHQLDVSILLYVNSWVGHSQAFDHLLLAVNDDFSLSGSVLFLLFGLVWYRSGEEETKVRLLAAMAATALVTGLSVLLQSVGHVHVRPMFDASLHLNIPKGIDPETWRTIGHLNSFPSDTTTLCAALAVTILMGNRKLGIAALVWTFIVIAFPRTYLTYHYPSDLAGGFLLAACVPLLARLPLLEIPARWIVTRSRTRPQWAQAFMLAYFIELSTMFQTVRMALHLLTRGH